jgi:S-adenosylmethionine-diacylglycerol 3-amino-3-carboxypropyl transferase
MRTVMKLPVEERKRQVKESLEPVMRSPWMKVILNSPINLLALGVNFTQCERMMSPDQNELVDFLVMHIMRVAETDLETNWFAWHSIAGHMNHDNPLAVPPFVRFDHHQSSLNAPTVVNYHHKNLFDVLGEAGPNTWTHYTLCDAVDWMPHDVQKKLLSEIIRTSEDGAIMLYRSVEDDSLAARHGLEKHIRLLAEESAQASKMDRTRQYLRVNFYQIVH